MNAAVERTCREYKRLLAAGEEPGDIVGWLAQEAGVNRPAIWKRLRAGGLIPGYKQRPHQPYRNRTRGVAFTPKVLPPAVDRDPCPRCGTRRDIGCEHSPCRLGMVL